MHRSVAFRCWCELSTSDILSVHPIDFNAMVMLSTLEGSSHGGVCWHAGYSVLDLSGGTIHPAYAKRKLFQLNKSMVGGCEG